MRRYVPSWLKKDRYLELLHFCRQYPDWKTEADTLIGTHGQKLDGMPHGTFVGDPVANTAERRAGLLAKVDLIDRCARAIDGGVWYTVLIQNVCIGIPYTLIDQTLVPTSNKNAFYNSRKSFFLLLDAEKEKAEKEKEDRIEKGCRSPDA